MYAVIDLGSNSFHLLIADYRDNQFVVVDRCSEKIQLAEGIAKTGDISKAAMARGINCLRHFLDVIQQHPITQIRAVGTQALRQSNNAHCFIEQAKAMNLDIDIISGEEEAELIFRGSQVHNPKEARLVIDIGGGSTEIAYGSDSQASFVVSIPVGCVTWRDRYFSCTLDYPNHSLEAKKEAIKIFAPVAEQLSQFRWQRSYASSGSAKMLSSILQSERFTEGEITPNSLQTIERSISKIDEHRNITLRGLKPERQDLLAPGLSIMTAIMNVFDLDCIYYSATALREGILADMTNLPVNYTLRQNPQH